MCYNYLLISFFSKRPTYHSQLNHYLSTGPSHYSTQQPSWFSVIHFFLTLLHCSLYCDHRSPFHTRPHKVTDLLMIYKHSSVSFRESKTRNPHHCNGDRSVQSAFGSLPLILLSFSYSFLIVDLISHYTLDLLRTFQYLSIFTEVLFPKSACLYFLQFSAQILLLLFFFLDNTFYYITILLSIEQPISPPPPSFSFSLLLLVLLCNLL